jgi:hypothetical protein
VDVTPTPEDGARFERVRVKKSRRGSGRGLVAGEYRHGNEQVRVVRRKSRSRHRRNRRVLRRVALSVAAVLGALALWAVLAYGPATRAKSDLLAGRRALMRGRAQLVAGDVTAAATSFRTARAAFAQASDEASSPAIGMVGFVPILGRTPDAVRQISEGGELIAQAGVDISDAVGKLPGGAAGLAPSGGTFPIDRYPAVAGALSRAAVQSRAGVASIEASASSWVLGPVARGRQEALAQVRDLPALFSRASTIVGRLPGFLGADGPRRYFIAAQSPAEMRGTGGFLGAFAVLTVDDGRFSFSPFQSVADLPDFAPDAILAPSPSYARNYDRFGGAGYWRNINMTPDFPSAAVAVERSYLKATGVRLDGVIGADPAMLADLLKVTGPVRDPDLGRTLTSSNVVPYLTNTAYVRFGDSDLRKPMLGEAASRIFDHFIRTPDPSLTLLRALGSAVSGGHLLLYSDDPAIQRVLVQGGAAGALAPTSGDLLGFVQNNAAGNKVDYYERRDVGYRVRLLPGGAASGEAHVVLSNTAPSSGPSYVIGPYDPSFRAGESVSWVGLYCGRGCTVGRVTRDGRAEPQQTGEELGHPFSLDYISIPSRETATLDYPVHTEGAWQGSASAGTYRLTVLGQPTVHPATVRVEITAPPGMRIVEATNGMRVSGDRATWSGTPGRALVLEVRFAEPQGLWDRVSRFLDRPLFHL